MDLKSYLLAGPQFRWKWCSSVYTAASSYRAFFHGRTSIVGASEIWKCKAPGQCKFFAWLVALGRCWTSDRPQRHHLPNSGLCALCDQEAETINHLLFGCVFSRLTSSVVQASPSGWSSAAHSCSLLIPCRMVAANKGKDPSRSPKELRLLCFSNNVDDLA
jgi:hypothetical protein